ncbi:pyridoxamine 5'-phosphate oxidase family protein [Niveibacterium sp. SC-1]|uniref:pyridoxamine 5'-phosphate oxidase family protein n=1 Tax=Niveibacterium sp. SC-1 TaxID=3135646 RepID=UPI00311D3371
MSSSHPRPPAEVMAPWRIPLGADLAAHVTRAEALYVQLATVRADGRPANRTLVFRGFLSGDRLAFITDLRSDKVAELACHPFAEACWYFPEARVQWRLLGEAQCLSEEGPELQHARSRWWRERDEAARRSFAGPRPGARRAEDEAFAVEAPVIPPAHFGLLVLAPDMVERLDLRATPHRRERWHADEYSWQAQRLNP